MIESSDPEGRRWTTVGVSANIIEASFEALEDSLTWRLYHGQAAVSAAELLTKDRAAIAR